jgi:hypothetical protein
LVIRGYLHARRWGWEAVAVRFIRRSSRGVAVYFDQEDLGFEANW